MMKIKKLERKLSLNKETIVNLGTLEMNAVKGGTDTLNSCPTICSECQSNTCLSCPPATYKCPSVRIFSCQCIPGETF
jgi:hypothetical protein